MRLFDVNLMRLRKKAARRTEVRGATSDSAVRAHAREIENGFVSHRAHTISKIMKTLEEERRSRVRLLKRHKIKYRRNRLWDRRQRNGKVTHIKP